MVGSRQIFPPVVRAKLQSGSSKFQFHFSKIFFLLIRFALWRVRLYQYTFCSHTHPRELGSYKQVRKDGSRERDREVVIFGVWQIHFWFPLFFPLQMTAFIPDWRRKNVKKDALSTLLVKNVLFTAFSLSLSLTQFPEYLMRKRIEKEKNLRVCKKTILFLLFYLLLLVGTVPVLYNLPCSYWEP